MEERKEECSHGAEARMMRSTRTLRMIGDEKRASLQNVC
jgi:hypothetical protein